VLDEFRESSGKVQSWSIGWRRSLSQRAPRKEEAAMRHVATLILVAECVILSEGTTLSVVNQGGEPHTFTEVSQFGGGFIEPLNHGEATVPECAGGFHNVAVAKTRILQGS